ncbi:hypothetical protein CTAYLR_000688 [Chrysophaeum taylorii]|uniref:Glycosyltransferase n=1 Tax=Chrysophaeum taylorii TaxID=2483200 RepID=A0AAD7XI92_9STRA|nr:hypothetical protein CTAYLR_000688 [Chrysophaeum taylorii]
MEIARQSEGFVSLVPNGFFAARWPPFRKVRRFIAAAKRFSSVHNWTRKDSVREAVRYVSDAPRNSRRTCSPEKKKNVLATRVMDAERLACVGAGKAPPQSIAIVTGVNERPPPNGVADVDLAASKRAYALRHGYEFLFYVPKDDGRPLEFSKIDALQDAAHNNRRHKWLVWMDADVWVNPRFATLGLDLWLRDVPKDRHIVLANYRGFNTGVLAVRSGRRGRELLAMWRAVADAGLASCHPHDQAALQYLQLWHLRNDVFGFNCTRTSPKAATCGGFWSCIPLWNEALRKAAGAGVFSYLRGTLPKWDAGDVVDRGFANPELAPFWVATETPDRPKLQCFRCTTSLDEASRYPGKNFPKLSDDAMDGFLLNHKAQRLFYQTAFQVSRDPNHPCFVPQSVIDHYKP